MNAELGETILGGRDVWGHGEKLLSIIGNWVLFEEASHESRIEISPDLDDLAVSEPANPAVAVIKPEAILRGGEGVQLHDGPVPTHQGVFHLQLRALRQDLRKLLERVAQKIRLAAVTTSKRMRSLDGPIYVVRNVGKEFISVAVLKSLEDFANLVECNRHPDVSSAVIEFVGPGGFLDELDHGGLHIKIGHPGQRR
jgi:hypothetical protein